MGISFKTLIHMKIRLDKTRDINKGIQPIVNLAPGSKKCRSLNVFDIVPKLCADTLPPWHEKSQQAFRQKRLGKHFVYEGEPASRSNLLGAHYVKLGYREAMVAIYFCDVVWFFERHVACANHQGKFPQEAAAILGWQIDANRAPRYEWPWCPRHLGAERGLASGACTSSLGGEMWTSL